MRHTDCCETCRTKLAQLEQVIEAVLTIQEYLMTELDQEQAAEAELDAAVSRITFDLSKESIEIADLSSQLTALANGFALGASGPQVLAIADALAAKAATLNAAAAATEATVPASTPVDPIPSTATASNLIDLTTVPTGPAGIATAGVVATAPTVVDTAPSA